MAAKIRSLIGQAIHTAFALVAFISLCGAAVTIGELGVPHSDTAKLVRLAIVATVGAFALYGVGYFLRWMILPRPTT